MSKSVLFSIAGLGPNNLSTSILGTTYYTRRSLHGFFLSQLFLVTLVLLFDTVNFDHQTHQVRASTINIVPGTSRLPSRLSFVDNIVHGSCEEHIKYLSTQVT